MDRAVVRERLGQALPLDAAARPVPAGVQRGARVDAEAAGPGGPAHARMGATLAHGSSGTRQMVGSPSTARVRLAIAFSGSGGPRHALPVSPPLEIDPE